MCFAFRSAYAGSFVLNSLQHLAFRSAYGGAVVLKFMVTDCVQVHFRRIIAVHTDVNLGDCSFLDTCRHMKVFFFLSQNSFNFISYKKH